MSPPLPAGPLAEPSGPAALRLRQTRRMNRLTGLLLLLSIGVALVTTVPAALRAIGIGGPPSPVPSASKLARLFQRPSPPRSRVGFGDSADDDSGAPRPRRPEIDLGGEPGDPAHIRLGVAPRGLRLLDEPRPASAPVGQIEPGEQVMIVKESGEWVLIAQNGEDGLTMGWARRSEIAIR